MNRNTKYVIYALLAVNAFLVCKGVISSSIWWAQRPSEYCISDILINYQGGFVRRGLLGEILFQLSSLSNLDPRCFIVPLCVISAAILICLLVRYFHREHLCLWILPTYYVLGGADYIRKDTIMMLFVFAIFKLLSQLLDGQRKLCILLILIVLLLNLHEASFFAFFPMLAVYLLFGTPNRTRLTHRIVVITISLAAMATLCIFKGDMECAEQVWHSWESVYPDEYCMFRYWSSIGALAWGTLDTIKMHIVYNFCDDPTLGWSELFIRPLVLFIILYLMIQISFVNHRGDSDYKRKTCLFAKFAIFQLLSMAPLMTILSCDFKRICFYWTVSSFMSYFLLKDMHVNVPFSKTINKWIAPCIKAISYPVRPVYPFVLLLFFSIPTWHGDPCRTYFSPLCSPVVVRVFWHVTHIQTDIDRILH